MKVEQIETNYREIKHIATYTGKVFDLSNPKPEMVCIKDIAHSLAYQCRYTGHTREFYSVAQHCVLMAINPELPGDSMAKLLHDADEAYIGDIAKPWKRLLRVQVGHGVGSLNISVGDFEDKIQAVIGVALGVDLAHSVEVKESDYRMMATEIRDLMPDMPPDFMWGVDVSLAIEEKIKCWSPEKAERMFLATYYILTKETTN